MTALINVNLIITGVEMSGIGKSGGKYSTEEFTERKWVSLDLGATS